MPKLTKAQLREKEVIKLASMHNPNYTTNDLAKAKTLMNSFYRLCGLSERNLYLENDYSTQNLASTKESVNREHRWYVRLSKEFEIFSGLTLAYCGYMPSIGYKDPHEGFEEKIERHFY